MRFVVNSLKVLTCVWACSGPALAAERALVSMRPTAGLGCACDLSSKVLPDYVMTPGSNFQRTRAVEARIQRLVAAGVRLDQADFTSANLPNARFTGTILRGATFRNARLPNSDFTSAVVTSVDFTGAQLRGADLQTAIGLTRAQLKSACGDAQTKLPEGMSITVCPSDAELTALPGPNMNAIAGTGAGGR